MHFIIESRIQTAELNKFSVYLFVMELFPLADSFVSKPGDDIIVWQMRLAFSLMEVAPGPFMCRLVGSHSAMTIKARVIPFRRKSATGHLIRPWFG